ncbi:S-adenosyl-L-methionine-dependent methyltransferase [Fadolivirus algeromassiliense]|jgi:hypothetical protein|uniref:S-adenosyl-L-methionine-dependent methyltransferase n=1 Tax=Fadolivirus FV1/VV64 TaxID=3070911 RepID=A0A7D3UV37_9VIRU|nr:S-adenosyl-L-methionine-dependent methyltransferase [Fadolivirus algeromassiliense]QKF94631.1 S-adenosyl-L-methionine-dependent methyltransferase [Fadolivirus FV1/VV64]
MKASFDNIYKNNIWNNNQLIIPRSGPGSSIENTKDIVKYLNNLKGFESCLDIGCGDVTWISQTNIFRKKYIGIDVSEVIINDNIKKYPDIKFHCLNALDDKLFDCDLFICRDVMFHLNKEQNIKLLLNIAKYKFKYIILTSSECHENLFDVNNRDQYCPVNLTKSPFNFNLITYTIKEPKFNRNILVISYNDYLDIVTKNLMN